MQKIITVESSGDICTADQLQCKCRVLLCGKQDSECCAVCFVNSTLCLIEAVALIRSVCICQGMHITDFDTHMYTFVCLYMWKSYVSRRCVHTQRRPIYTVSLWVCLCIHVYIHVHMAVDTCIIT